MHKRYLGAGTAVALSAVLLSGCAVNNGGSAASDGSTTLTLAWQSGTAKDVIQPTIDQFEKDHPGVKVNLTTAADADLLANIRTQLAAGNAPDLFLVQPGTDGGAVGALGKAGLVAPLDDLDWATKSDAGARAVMSYDGKVYGVTPGLTSISAIYNQDALDQAGLKAPTTWDELLQFCSDAKTKGKIAFGLGLQEGWTTVLVPEALNAGYITNQEKLATSLSDGSFDYASDPGWNGALDKQAEMLKAGCFNDSPAGTSMDNVVLPGVTDGSFLGTVSVSAHIGVMESSTATPPAFIALPLPATNDSNEQNFQTIAANGLAINAASKNIDLAKDFLNSWTSDESLASIGEATGTIPSVADSKFDAPKSLSALVASSADGHTISVQPIAGTDTQQALIDGVQGIVLGSSSTTATLDAMQKAYQATLK